MQRNPQIPESPDDDFTQNYGSKFETRIAKEGPRVTLPWPGVVVNMSFGTAAPLKHPKTRGRSCLTVHGTAGSRDPSASSVPAGTVVAVGSRRPGRSRHCHDVQRAGVVDSGTSVEPPWKKPPLPGRVQSRAGAISLQQLRASPVLSPAAARVFGVVALMPGGCRSCFSEE